MKTEEFYIWSVPKYFIQTKLQQLPPVNQFEYLTKTLFKYLCDWSVSLQPLTFIHCCQQFSFSLSSFEDSRENQRKNQIKSNNFELVLKEKFPLSFSDACALKFMILLFTVLFQKNEEETKIIQKEIEIVLFKYGLQLSFKHQYNLNEPKEISFVLQLFLESQLLLKEDNYGTLNSMIAQTDFSNLLICLKERKIKKNSKQKKDQNKIKKVQVQTKLLKNQSHQLESPKENWLRKLQNKRKTKGKIKNPVVQKQQESGIKNIQKKDKYYSKKYDYRKNNLRLPQFSMFVAKPAHIFTEVIEPTNDYQVKQRPKSKKKIQKIQNVVVDEQEMIVLAQRTP